MADSAQIKGADKVLAMLRSLPDEVTKKGGNAVRSGLRDGLRIIMDAAGRNLDAIVAAPNVGGADLSTGTLKGALRMSRTKPPAGEKGEAYIFRIKRGVKYPAERGENITAAQVGRLLEEGSEKRAPMPWVRPAYEQNKEAAAQTAVDSISKRLDAIFKRLSR